MNSLSVKSSVFIGGSQVHEELTVIKFQRENNFCQSLLPTVILPFADMNFPLLDIGCSQSPNIHFFCTECIHASPLPQTPVLFLQQSIRIFSFISTEAELEASLERCFSTVLTTYSQTCTGLSALLDNTSFDICQLEQLISQQNI